MKTFGYAARSATTPLAPFNFERRDLRPNDIAMDVLYCGVCHSDLHMARDDWRLELLSDGARATRSSAASPRSAPR